MTTLFGNLDSNTSMIDGERNIRLHRPALTTEQATRVLERVNLLMDYAGN